MSSASNDSLMKTGQSSGLHEREASGASMDDVMDVSFSSGGGKSLRNPGGILSKDADIKQMTQNLVHKGFKNDFGGMTLVSYRRFRRMNRFKGQIWIIMARGTKIVNECINSTKNEKISA